MRHASFLDHFGFIRQTRATNLLDLARYSQAYVKVSALFRQGDVAPYKRVNLECLDPLLQAFGSDRLLFGTDFPVVLEQNQQYKWTVDLVSSCGWPKTRKVVLPSWAVPLKDFLDHGVSRKTNCNGAGC